MKREANDRKIDKISKKSINTNSLSQREQKDNINKIFPLLLSKNNFSPSLKNTWEKEKKIERPIKNRELTIEEKKRLLKLNIEHGNKWLKLCSFFENINEKNLKNQFFSLIRKALRNATKILGIKKNSQFVTLIKTKSLSEFITYEIEVDLNDGNLKRKKTKKLNLVKINFHDFIERFVFFDYLNSEEEFEKKDFFIIKKSLEFLVNLNYHRQIKNKKKTHFKKKIVNEKNFLLKILNFENLLMKTKRNFFNVRDKRRKKLKKRNSKKIYLKQNYINKKNNYAISKNFSLTLQKTNSFYYVNNDDNLFISSKNEFIIIF